MGRTYLTINCLGIMEILNSVWVFHILQRISCVPLFSSSSGFHLSMTAASKVLKNVIIRHFIYNSFPTTRIQNVSSAKRKFACERKLVAPYYLVNILRYTTQFPTSIALWLASRLALLSSGILYPSCMQQSLRIISANEKFTQMI